MGSLKRVLDRTDELRMIANVSIFYFGQDERSWDLLEDSKVNPDFTNARRRKCLKTVAKENCRHVSLSPRNLLRALTRGHCGAFRTTLRPDPEMSGNPETCWRTEMDSNRRSGLRATCPGKHASIRLRNSPREKLHRLVACSRYPPRCAGPHFGCGQGSGRNARGTLISVVGPKRTSVLTLSRFTCPKL
jgi:hypothetical protein